jgi:hypothetical protein
MAQKLTVVTQEYQAPDLSCGVLSGTPRRTRPAKAGLLFWYSVYFIVRRDYANFIGTRPLPGRFIGPHKI